MTHKIEMPGANTTINGVTYTYKPNFAGGAIHLSDGRKFDAADLLCKKQRSYRIENSGELVYNFEDLPWSEFNAMQVLTAHFKGAKVKKLVIVRGLPGSGKSTLTQEKYPDATVCSADHFMVNSKGEYEFNPSRLGYAHGSCKRKAEKAMAKGTATVVIDNTNIKRRDFSQYLKLAKRFGYVVQYETIFDAGLTDAQLAERNTHNVGADTIANMRKKWQVLDENGLPVK